MSSSKAGFISRRRTELLLLVLLIVASPLSSAEFRVGIYSDSEGGRLMLDKALASIGSYADSSYAYEKAEARASLESERAYLEALDEAYQNEKDTSSVRRTESDVSGRLAVRIIELSPSDAEKPFLISGSADASAYFSLKEGLDLLAVIRSEKLDGVDLLSLYLNGSLMHESLYVSSLIDEDLETVIGILLPFFRSGNARVYRLSYPDSASLSIDGVSFDSGSPFAVLDKGPHRFTLAAPLYKTMDAEIVLDELLDIILEPELEEPQPLFISPRPYGAQLNYQGKLIGSHLVAESVPPFSVTASYPGFALYSFDTTKPLSQLSFSMKPEWMAAENILEREKGEFYGSLFSALVSFGLSVASGTLQRIYNEHYFGPFDVVFTGVSLVSLVWMADSMFSYFDAARYGL